MKIITTKRFEKRYSRLQITLQKKVDTALRLFIDNPFSPKLHNHQLSGNLSAYRSINITGDRRIHFRELSEGNYELIELVDIGTHSHLYG